MEHFDRNTQFMDTFGFCVRPMRHRSKRMTSVRLVKISRNLSLNTGGNCFSTLYSAFYSNTDPQHKDVDNLKIIQRGYFISDKIFECCPNIVFHTFLITGISTNGFLVIILDFNSVLVSQSFFSTSRRAVFQFSPSYSFFIFSQFSSHSFLICLVHFLDPRPLPEGTL